MGDDTTTNDKPTEQELGELKAQLEAELKQAELWRAERSNLEAEVQRLTVDVEALKGERDTTLESLRAERNNLEAAVAKYRDLVTATNPAIPGDLIQGVTIEEIDASIVKASALVEKVKAALENQAKQSSVPAGAPARTSTPPEGLSSREKIRYALEKKG